MGKRLVNPDSLCMGCMTELQWPGMPCPKWGFDIRKYQKPKNSLPPYEILNGKYLLGRVLGIGGFGITYIAWDFYQAKRVCVKEGDRCSKYLWTHVFRAAFGFSSMQYGDVHAALGQDPVCLYERAGGLYQRGRKSVALLSDAGYCFSP